MVFGTFDLLHLGHLEFFKQARQLAPNVFLIVSIARDVNVARIKGALPLYSENERRKMVMDSAAAHAVVLGGVDDYRPHVREHAPHIIALGYDQHAYVDTLQKDISSGMLGKVEVRRLAAFKPDVYKSSILKQYLAGG
jgi:FAD synthetase